MDFFIVKVCGSMNLGVIHTTSSFSLLTQTYSFILLAPFVFGTATLFISLIYI